MNQEKQKEDENQQDLGWIDQYPDYHQEWMKRAASRGDSKEDILKRLDILEQTM